MSRRQRKAPDFAEALVLFGRHRHRMHIAKNGPSDLIAEAHLRLEQAAWLVERVKSRQGAQHRYSARGPRRASRLSHARWATTQRTHRTEIQLLCESFYYFAFRLITILEDDLEGFKRLSRKLAITRVRNELIEHPKVRAPTFMWGVDMPGGPRIKPFGERHDGKKRFHDQGLYINAQELLDKLTPRLRAATPASNDIN